MWHNRAFLVTKETSMNLRQILAIANLAEKLAALRVFVVGLQTHIDRLEDDIIQRARASHTSYLLRSPALDNARRTLIDAEGELTRLQREEAADADAEVAELTANTSRSLTFGS